MTGIRIRVQEHDCHRLRTGQQRRERLQFGRVERLDDLTVGSHPALDAMAVIAVYERWRTVPDEGV